MPVLLLGTFEALVRVEMIALLDDKCHFINTYLRLSHWLAAGHTGQQPDARICLILCHVDPLSGFRHLGNTQKTHQVLWVKPVEKPSKKPAPNFKLNFNLSCQQ